MEEVVVKERAIMSKIFYPDKVNVERFAYQIQKDIPTFVTNMRNLPGVIAEEMYMEEWMGLFVKWMECNNEG